MTTSPFLVSEKPCGKVFFCKPYPPADSEICRMVVRSHNLAEIWIGHTEELCPLPCIQKPFRHTAPPEEMLQGICSGSLWPHPYWGDICPLQQRDFTHSEHRRASAFRPIDIGCSFYRYPHLRRRYPVLKRPSHRNSCNSSEFPLYAGGKLSRLLSPAC